MKKIGIVLVIALSLFPTFVRADCTYLEHSTHWIVDDSHSIIFYDRTIPLARVEIPYCEISPSSKVLLLSSYVCESDKIVIDGVSCLIITVRVLY